MAAGRQTHTEEGTWRPAKGSPGDRPLKQLPSCAAGVLLLGLGSHVPGTGGGKRWRGCNPEAHSSVANPRTQPRDRPCRRTHSADAITFRLLVDGHGPVDQAGIQALGRAGKAHDRGLVRGKEVLQTHLLGALAALVNGDASREERKPCQCICSGRKGSLISSQSARDAPALLASSRPGQKRCCLSTPFASF